MHPDPLQWLWDGVIHRADESKGLSPLLPQNFIPQHNIGQKFLADKGEKAKLDYWNYHNIAKSLKAKVETCVEEYKHRVGILQDTPRAEAEQEQEVVGLFRTYDIVYQSRCGASEYETRLHRRACEGL
jgi:hypothetical protein